MAAMSPPQSLPTTAPRRSLREALRQRRLAFARDAHAQANLKMILTGSISLALAFVISLVFFPIINSSVADAQADANTSPSDSAMLDLLPTLFVVVLVLAGVGAIFIGFKTKG